MEEEPVVTKAAAYTPGFERFWQAYPAYKRKAKKKAFETWKKDKLEDLTQTIVFAVEHQSNFDDHFQKYTPMPVTYLNQARWEDERVKPKKPKKNAVRRDDSPPPPEMSNAARTANMILLKSLLWAGEHGHTVKSDSLAQLIDIKNANVEDYESGRIKDGEFLYNTKRDIHGVLKKLPRDDEYLEKIRQDFVQNMQAGMAKAERARIEMGEVDWYRRWKEGA